MAVLMSNVDAAAPNPVGPAVDQPAQEVVLTKDNWQQFARLQNGVLTISAQVTEIGVECFAGNKQIRIVNFEPGSRLHTIRRSALSSESLMLVELPDSLRTIERGAFPFFQRCTISFGANSQLSTVSDHAFRDNHTLIVRSEQTHRAIMSRGRIFETMGPNGVSPSNPEIVMPADQQHR